MRKGKKKAPWRTCLLFSMINLNNSTIINIQNIIAMTNLFNYFVFISIKPYASTIMLHPTTPLIHSPLTVKSTILISLATLYLLISLGNITSYTTSYSLKAILSYTKNLLIDPFHNNNTNIFFMFQHPYWA